MIDPAYASGGMFVQSLKFLEEHSGNSFDISVYGQESNPTTWKLAKMNLAIRGIENNLGSKNADTFHEDLHPSLKADFVLANPPFNQSDWGQPLLLNDPRWKYGVPPSGNANYGWIEHIIDKLSQDGKAAVVLANGSLSSNTSNEGEIRKNILEADLVDAIVALPDKLFYTTGIPVCIWFFNRNKKNKGETLFIDARKMGTMVSRKLRELTDEDIKKISDTYHAYNGNGEYEDKLGYSKKVTIDEIRNNDYILTPGRYVGIEEEEDDGEPFEEKMERLTKTLSEQFAKSKKQKNIRRCLLLKQKD